MRSKSFFRDTPCGDSFPLPAASREAFTPCRLSRGSQQRYNRRAHAHRDANAAVIALNEFYGPVKGVPAPSNKARQHLAVGRVLQRTTALSRQDFRLSPEEAFTELLGSDPLPYGDGVPMHLAPYEAGKVALPRTLEPPQILSLLPRLARWFF